MERTVNVSDNDRYIELLRRNGFVLVESGLSSAEIARARTVVDEIYLSQAKDVGGEELLDLINDKNIARAVCAYDDLMLQIATLPAIMNLADEYLRQAFVLSSQNGIINPPSDPHYKCTWHRDLNYQHYTSSRPLALSVLLALDPFNANTGGTYVLPGSHLFETFPSDEYVIENQKVITCDEGTLIFFDPMMFHRTGFNYSKNTRRGINHIINAALLNQAYDFKRIFKSKGVEISDSKLAKYIFGYGSASSIEGWRNKKIEQYNSTETL